MTDQREQEIRDEQYDEDTTEVRDYLFSLLDRARGESRDNADAAESWHRSWEKEREQVAELLEALEEHRCPHCEGLYRDGSRVEGCANKGHRAIAKHKEWEMSSRSAVGHMGFSENLKVIPEEPQ